MNHRRKICLVFVASLLCFAAPSLVEANSISITGTASAVGAAFVGFNFTGPSLQLYSHTLDYFLSPSSCTIPSAYDFEGLGGGLLHSSGTVNGIHATLLAGHLTVSPCFGPGSAASRPATIMGDIYGYQSKVGSLGPMVFAVKIQGTGNVVLTGPPHATQAYYTMTSGTATLTPEPASLLLFATGLIGLALVVRRRVRRKA